MYRNQILIVILLMGLVALSLGCSKGVDVEQQNKAILAQALDAMNNHEYD